MRTLCLKPVTEAGHPHFRIGTHHFLFKIYNIFTRKLSPSLLPPFLQPEVITNTFNRVSTGFNPQKEPKEGEKCKKSVNEMVLSMVCRKSLHLQEHRTVKGAAPKILSSTQLPWDGGPKSLGFNGHAEVGTQIMPLDCNPHQLKVTPNIIQNRKAHHSNECLWLKPSWLKTCLYRCTAETGDMSKG